MKRVMGKWGVFNGINLGRVGRWEVKGLCLLIKGFKGGRGEVTGGGRLKKSVFIERGALNTGLGNGSHRTRVARTVRVDDFQTRVRRKQEEHEPC